MATAVGGGIDNSGKRTVGMGHGDGHGLRTTFTRSDVEKPITSAGRLDRHGYRSALDGGNSYAEDRVAGQRHRLGLKNDMYAMRAKLKVKPDEGRQVNNDMPVEVTQEGGGLGNYVPPEGGSNAMQQLQELDVPAESTSEEVGENNRSHLLFRNWCASCFRGRGCDAIHFVGGAESCK